MPRVGLAKGASSYDTVKAALSLVRDDINIPDDRPVLIKVNMVSPEVELAATPVSAARATMDFLSELGVKRFIVGEASGIDGDTMGGFRRFGYFLLKDHYNVEFRDLNRDESVTLEALDLDLAPVNIRLARTFFDSYVVSVGRMKTHAIVGATLSLKNVAIGSITVKDRHSPALYKPEPGWFSHEPVPLNLSIARINQVIYPDLAVIDGVVGMEGPGPMKGTPVLSGVSLASTDGLSLDMVGCQVMGHDYQNVGHLYYTSELRGLSREQVQVVGERPEECVTRYQPHQLSDKWRLEDWKSYLSGSYLRTAYSTTV
jgi:uncharacterized protein (DUF362 family)